MKTYNTYLLIKETMGYTNIGNRGESVLKESIFYKHGRNKLMVTRFLLKKLDMH